MKRNPWIVLEGHISHGDVIKWKHFPRYWPFVRGIHRWIPSTKSQWSGALMFSLTCAWINGWVNNREAGDLRRHRAHYDVIVMSFGNPCTRCARPRLCLVHKGTQWVVLYINNVVFMFMSGNREYCILCENKIQLIVTPSISRGISSLKSYNPFGLAMLTSWTANLCMAGSITKR